MTEVDRPDFDSIDFFTDMSLVDDPFPYFAHLRQKCPVAHLPHHDVIGITGYDEAYEVDRSNDVFSSCNSASGPFPGFSVKPHGDDITEFIALHRHELPLSEYMVTQDLPEHELHRGLIVRLLTPKRMRENEAAIRARADRQIDEFIERGTFEAVHDYGQSFALLVIADLLGVPEEDHTEFRKHLGALPQVAEGGPGEVAHDPLGFLTRRFTEFIEDRRSVPRHDVMTQIATATNADGSIPDVDVVVRMATFLFAAGQDTTARLVTAALHVIAERPDIQAYLRADHSRIPNFLEEVLRLEGPVKSKGRMARLTTTLAGVQIPAGSVVTVFPGAANRDPRRFEDPDEFRADRPNAKEHLAFGRGIHSCPGGPLARLEAQISIECFLSRMSDIRIDEAYHGPPGARRYQQEPLYILRGLNALHLQFAAAEIAAAEAAL
jgi:cytochrome P450